MMKLIVTLIESTIYLLLSLSACSNQNKISFKILLINDNHLQQQNNDSERQKKTLVNFRADRSSVNLTLSRSFISTFLW